MFSRSRSGRGRHNFGQPKKESNSKRHHIRAWIVLNKHKKKQQHGVMMSGDSPPPPLRVSSPSLGFDVPDDARPGKTSPTDTGKALKSTPDTEAIEEAVPIIEKTLPAPEPKPKIEKNGSRYDTADGKKLVSDDRDDDSCVIKCISFTQQCCDCTIL